MNDPIDGVFEDTPTAALMTATAAAALNKSDVEAQLDAAHKYPRNIKRFLSDAAGMVTMTRDVAKSCMYALKREGQDGAKIIPGPSVRLAEIAASAYGNLHVAARVLDAGDTEIVAQGVCWDLEKNVRISMEARRRITKRGGQRFGVDMIVVTGNAAASIALRNAIFRVIPGAYIQHLYNIAKNCAIGEGLTLPQQRDEAFATLLKMGVTEDRVLGKLGRGSLQDVKLGDIELLIGLTTTIREGGERADDVFPPLGGPKPTNGAAPGDPDLEQKLRGGKSAASPPTPPKEEPKALPEKQAAAAQVLGIDKAQPEPEKVPVKTKTKPATPQTPATVSKSDDAPGQNPEKCCVCSKSIDWERDGVPTNLPDGKRAYRHEACTPDPWGLGGESGEPKA